MSLFRTSMREICNQNTAHFKDFSPICMRTCVFTIHFVHDKLKSKCTIGQEGEQRKSYSAAVIDDIERNYRVYVG